MEGCSLGGGQGAGQGVSPSAGVTACRVAGGRQAVACGCQRTVTAVACGPLGSLGGHALALFQAAVAGVLDLGVVHSPRALARWAGGTVRQQFGFLGAWRDPQGPAYRQRYDSRPAQQPHTPSPSWAWTCTSARAVSYHRGPSFVIPHHGPGAGCGRGDTPHRLR